MSPPELSSTPCDFHVKARMVGKRIDAYLASRYPDYSRSVIQKVIDAGAVLVNGAPTKASYKVRLDDLIRVWLPELADDLPVPEDIPIPVVYEDPVMTVVNKPAGMVTHPAKGHWSGTLVNALQFHFDTLSSLAGEHRPGIVHRLDRDTSGLLVVARSEAVHATLSEALHRREVRREYVALVEGIPDARSGTIDAPVGRDRADRTLISTTSDRPRSARTHFEIREALARTALLALRLETGRTHQIRAHLAAIEHPVCGDARYGGRSSGARLGLERQFLHSSRLGFVHPLTGEELDFESALPGDLEAALERARAESPPGARRED